MSISADRAWLIIGSLLSAAAAIAHAAAPTHLVANSSFESGEATRPAAWRGDPAVYAVDHTVARTGKASLRYLNDNPARYALCTQRLSLQPGWKVRASAWIKTQDLLGPESGATICIEWTDRSGQWLGGCYPHGISGTHDWTRIELVTRIPSDAGAVSLACYARRGMTGRAWFDDVQVVRVMEPPMSSTVLWPVYRGRIPAAATAAVKTRIRLNAVDLALAASQLRIEASIQRQGKVLARATTRPVPLMPTDLSIPAAGLAPGDYDLDLRLVGPAGQELQLDRHPLTQLAPGDRFACDIDEHRRLRVDGKPFFPLGMYWGGISEEDLKLYADSRFNCIMPYAAPSRAQLDLAQRHGIRVIYSIKDWYCGLKSCPSFIRSAEVEEQAVRQRVRQMRDHPAVLAWYLNDELGQEYLPRLEAHQRWAAEEDPQHPTWAVLFQVDEVRAYLRTFDIIGTDPYPIGRKPASMAAQWTSQTFGQVERSRPMWQVPQVFNWANYSKGDAGKSHTPTPSELRSMAWQCICEGATGLVFYSWYDLKRNPDVPFEKQWQTAKLIAAEIDRFAPILLSAEPPDSAAIEGAAPPWLHWTARASRGRLFIFAASDGDGQGPVAFRLPPGWRSVRELTSGRAVRLRAGGFADDLPRLEVRVYEVRFD